MQPLNYFRCLLNIIKRVIRVIDDGKATLAKGGNNTQRALSHLSSFNDSRRAGPPSEVSVPSSAGEVAPWNTTTMLRSTQCCYVPRTWHARSIINSCLFDAFKAGLKSAVTRESTVPMRWKLTESVSVWLQAIFLDGSLAPPALQIRHWHLHSTSCALSLSSKYGI